MTTIPKVRGHIRAESRIKATASPSGYKQLTSQLDKDANDNITLSGSALEGDVIVTAAIDHEGGVAVSVIHKGERVLLASVPAPQAIGSLLPSKVTVPASTRVERTAP